jgi:hypothetical protein
MSTIALGMENGAFRFDKCGFYLGGLMNVMPMMFSKLKQTREEVRTMPGKDS